MADSGEEAGGSAGLFLSTTRTGGVSRAFRRTDGSWSVSRHLAEADVRCLAADPRNPWIVFAGTQGAGVYKSDDAGETWQAAGLAGRVVKTLAVSRLGTLYAGTKPAYLFVSPDHGSTWTELDGFRRIRSRWFWFSPAELPFQAYVQALAISPDDPRVILAGIEAGAVVRSDDGGETWTNHQPGALRDCHSLTFHATDGAWSYQGGSWPRSGGVAISTDAGQTWTRPKGGIDRTYGWAVAADPAHPEICYVSTAPGPGAAHGGRANAAIYRREGTRWARLRAGLPDPLDAMPYALLTDIHQPGRVYAGLATGVIYFSSDHGDTWHRLPVELSGIRSLVMLHI